MLPVLVFDRVLDRIEKNSVAAMRLTNDAIVVLISIVSAFLVRYYWIPSESVIGWDGVYYATLGKKIVSGDIYGGISPYWSPLYSSLVGLSSLIFQDVEFAGRVVSLIAGSLLVIPTYYLILNFYGRAAAYIGTLLLIIHPGLIRSSVWVMTESLYTLLFTTGVLIAWQALVGGKARHFFLTGILFGAAYLTKPEAIGFLGLLFVFIVGGKLIHGKSTFRSLPKNYLLLLLGFIIFFLPYVAFLYAKTGHLTISQKLLNNFTAVDYDRGMLQLTEDGQTTLQDQLFGDIYGAEIQPTETSSSVAPPPVNSAPARWSLGRFLSSLVNNLKILVRQYIPETLLWPSLFIILIVIGFFYHPWTRWQTAKEIYLLSFFVCTLFGYAATVIQVRYLFPILPIIIGWIANGTIQFGNWASNTVSNVLQTRKRVDPIFAQIFTLLIIGSALVYSIPTQMLLESWEKLPFEEKQAGLWIKNHSALPPLIMAQGPIVAYYAGADHIFVPNEDLPTVLKYAKRKNVNYLVLSERRWKDTPKAFQPSGPNLPEEITLVYKDDQMPNYKIFVYQLAN